MECIKKDLEAQLQGRSDISHIISAILFGRGFHLMLSYRLQKQLLKVPYIGKILAKIIWYLTSTITACDISFLANLGNGIYIPHPTGIVIGQGTIIGNNATIYQGVTVGQKSNLDIENPIISDDVYLGAGCKIIGNIKIGKNVTIGANAVVLSDIPDNATAVGIPAKILQKNTESISA